MAYQTISTSLERGCFTVTLQRPERLNALSAQMLAEILRALDEADADDEVRVVLFTGAGRAFCAGADLGGGGGTFDAGPDRSAGVPRDGGGLLTLRLFQCRKPVVEIGRAHV